MKKYCIALILAGWFVSPFAQAEEAQEDMYLGIAYARLSVEDVKPDNLAIIVGGSAENGFGGEVFYMSTISDDTETVGSTKFKYSTDALGLLATYKTPGKVYVKGKAGWATYGVKIVSSGNPSQDESHAGLVYGLGVGVKFTTGSVELTYLKFPDLDEFDGIALDSTEVDSLSLAYQFHF